MHDCAEQWNVRLFSGPKLVAQGVLLCSAALHNVFEALLVHMHMLCIANLHAGYRFHMLPTVFVLLQTCMSLSKQWLI